MNLTHPMPGSAPAGVGGGSCGYALRILTSSTNFVGRSDRGQTEPPPDQLRRGLLFLIGVCVPALMAISAAFRLFPEDVTTIEAITDDSEQRVRFAGVLVAQLPKLLWDVVDVLLREQRVQIRRGQLRNVNRLFCHPPCFSAMYSHFHNISPYLFVFVGVFPLSLV